MTFFDREGELATLDAEYDTDQFGFVVLYGRRRVGKTELIKEFCAETRSVYYLAAQEAESRQRQKLVERIASAFDERVPQIDAWDDAFEYIGEKLTEESVVLAIDEFPYLVEENESVPSYVQALVDEHVRDSSSLLILCGSSVGVMESDVLGHESPLYGRRTAQIDLQPFDFTTARPIIGYDVETAITSYATTGGTPMYLTLFDYGESFEANVLEHVLSNTSVLYNEPEFLLRTELRNPSRYMSILEAIATGHTTPNEIAGATNIDAGPLSKYLQTLRRLRLIDRIVPVTESQKKSKRSRYDVGDNFLRFWFRFVEPNRSGIEQSPRVVFENTIEPALSVYVSGVFEDVCRELVWRAGPNGSLRSEYPQVGEWWYSGEEIDVVAVDPSDDRLLLGECKWTTSPVGHGVASKLEAKADSVRWHDGVRSVEYALFSKRGFTDGLADELGDDWTLFDLADVDAMTDTTHTR